MTEKTSPPTTTTSPPDKPAANSKMMVPYLTQDEAKYDANGGTYNPRSEACSTCRFFRERDGEYGTPGGYECAIVESWPAPIVSNGWCEWFAKRPSYEPEPMPVVIVEVETGERSAEREGGTLTPEGEGGHYYRAPPSNIIVRGKTEPAIQRQTIFKDAAGRRYMLITTSNGYQDREEEWIPAAELKSYVDGCWIDEKTFQSDNPLLFWHNDELAAGDIIWASMQGSFLMELAREGDTAIAKALWDYREQNPNNELWGASHRFRYRTRTADGVYHGVRKEETTFLPLWAAANLLTMSEVITVTKQHDDYLNKMFEAFGVSNAAALLRSGHQALETALAQAGMGAKSTDGSAATPIFSRESAGLIVQLVDAQSDFANRIEALETKAKEAPGIPADLQATINTLAAGVKQIQQALELDPTEASTDPDTQLPDGDPQAKAAAAEFKQKEVGGMYDPAFPGMNIPLPGAGK